MVMFLTILLMSVAVLAVSCVAFAAAVSREEKRVEPPAVRERVPEAPRFFAADTSLPLTRPQIPLEVLLSQLERHVRLEQAAAQSFLELPSPDSLHSRTESPLVN